MPNGPARTVPALSIKEIKKFIEKKKKEDNIIIENTAEDLAMPADANRAVPLLNHAIDDNIFLRQVAAFVKADKSGPVSVEYLRWADALFRLNNSVGDTNTMPDVVQVGGLIEKEKPSKPFEESVSNELYSVAWFVDTRVMYYNKNSIRDPSSLASWDDFLDLCEKWKPGPQKLIVFPIGSEWNLLHNLASWIWAAGGDIISTNKTSIFFPYEVDLDKQKSINGVMYLKKIADAGCADFVETSSSEVENMFLTGKYAAVITGTWFTSKLAPDWAETYGVAMIPAGKAGSVPFMGGSHLSIWKGAELRGNMERSVRFIKYITDTEQQYAFALETGFLPTDAKALEMYSRYLSSPVFEKSVKMGRSYPDMPQWSDIVEKGIAREHIWQLWRNIAARQPPTVIVATLKSAATELRKKILVAKLQKHFGAEATLFLGLMGLVGFGFYNSRRRTARLRMANISLAQRIKTVEGQYDITMGKLTLLERKHKEIATESQIISEDLEKYRKKSQELFEELGYLQKKQNGLAHKKLGDFLVKWDGTLLIEGKELSFDNNLQAKRMINFLVRAAKDGLTSIHCIWGCPLFEWDLTQVKSDPNRLFNTAVSKLNNPIKKKGLPPILISQGKGSHTWRLVWDRNALIKNSDVGRAHDLINKARVSLSKEFVNDGLLSLKAAIETDPLCIDGYMLLDEFEWRKLAKEDSLGNAIIGCFESAQPIIASYIKNLETGVQSVVRFLDGPAQVNFSHGEVLKHELICMQSMLSRFKDIYACCFSGNPMHVSLHLKSLLESLKLSHKAMEDLRSSGIPRQVIWSEIAHNENFIYFTSSPKVSAVMNNFYNSEICAVEDERLVKLALIWMLEKPDMISPLFSASTEASLVNAVKSQLGKQLRLLSRELIVMSDVTR